MLISFVFVCSFFLSFIFHSVFQLMVSCVCLFLVCLFFMFSLFLFFAVMTSVLLFVFKPLLSLFFFPICSCHFRFIFSCLSCLLFPFWFFKMYCFVFRYFVIMFIRVYHVSFSYFVLFVMFHLIFPFDLFILLLHCVSFLVLLLYSVFQDCCPPDVPIRFHVVMFAFWSHPRCVSILFGFGSIRFTQFVWFKSLSYPTCFGSTLLGPTFKCWFPCAFYLVWVR